MSARRKAVKREPHKERLGREARKGYSRLYGPHGKYFVEEELRFYLEVVQHNLWEDLKLPEWLEELIDESC